VHFNTVELEACVRAALAKKVKLGGAEVEEGMDFCFEEEVNEVAEYD